MVETMLKHCIPVLTIAGSDSGGGAGIEADIKTIEALGGYASAAITAVTAQNTLGVAAVEAVTPSLVSRQIEAVMTDIEPKAVKIGMTCQAAVVSAIADSLRQYCRVPIVLDPVMVSTSGAKLLNDDAVSVMISKLIPMATLLTPNIPEAERLSGITCHKDADYAEMAQSILNMGCHAVLIKGGHALKENNAIDRLNIKVDKDKTETHIYSHSRVETNNTHGTGCTLSSAIAFYLACGLPLTDAVDQGISYLHDALLHAKDIQFGHGHGPVNHTFNPKVLIAGCGPCGRPHP
jgi:hydroxymethylpyrimidine/phosphomethylpyrimidine kinase